jgi:hypothetical protein
MADYEELADRLDEEAEAMQRRSEQLGDEAGQAREDWERKRADPNVPGAPSPEAVPEEPSPPADDGG